MKSLPQVLQPAAWDQAQAGSYVAAAQQRIVQPPGQLAGAALRVPPADLTDHQAAALAAVGRYRSMLAEVRDAMAVRKFLPTELAGGAQEDGLDGAKDAGQKLVSYRCRNWLNLRHRN